MIATLPNRSEVFDRMLREMDENRSRNLIVDLRDNTGGMTPITPPTLYQLFGDRYLDTDMDTRSFRMISPLYLHKLNQTLDEFNEGRESPYRSGDVLTSRKNRESGSIRERREAFIASPVEAIRGQCPANGEPGGH